MMSAKHLNEEYEMVPIGRLIPHERNVNQGDWGAIQQSIEANGFFGALVVQRSTGKILAGNHRYAVAKSLGFTELPVTWVDVDDDKALRILLADNRTARLGTDNDGALAALLAELSETPAGLAGTGFNGDDLDQLIADLGHTSVTEGMTTDRFSQQQQIEKSRKGRDDGRNPDGSIWAICPECDHEFEVVPPYACRKTHQV
jgi:hypothetical protein